MNYIILYYILRFVGQKMGKMIDDDDDRIIIKAFRRRIKELYEEKYSNCQIKKITYEENDGIFKANIFTDLFNQHEHEYTFGLQTNMNKKMCNDNWLSKQYYDNDGITTYEDMNWDEYIDFSFYVYGMQFYCREEI